MKIKGLFAGVMIAATALATQSHAGTIPFLLSGAGLSGSGTITYGPDPVAGDAPNALAITGMSGTFSDSTVGISGATITGIVAIDPVSPPKEAPFPNSFSLLTVTNPPPMDSGISYDNLFYSGVGSPDVCPGYPGFGGFLDIYGVVFALDNGDLVDFFSNGAIPPPPVAVPLNYGAVVMESTDMGTTVIDNVSDGVSAQVPEPGSLLLLGSFLIGAAALRRR